MVTQPNNFNSIFGGIFRGLSNNKTSGGLNQTNTQNRTNPLTYQWIGFSTSSDLRQPIQKEQTQNPSLPFEKGSSGTNVSFSPPVLTDIPTLLNQGSPGTNVSFRNVASSVGSQTNPTAGFGPISNFVGNGYGMSPQNGDHFKTFFANQIGLSNLLPKAIAGKTALDIANQQHDSSGGSTDSWKAGFQLFNSMQKAYNPMGNLGTW